MKILLALFAFVGFVTYAQSQDEVIEKFTLGQTEDQWVEKTKCFQDTGVFYERCFKSNFTCREIGRVGMEPIYEICYKYNTTEKSFVDESRNYYAKFSCSSPLKVLKGLSSENSVGILSLEKKSGAIPKSYFYSFENEDSCSNFLQSLEYIEAAPLEIQINKDTKQFIFN